MIDRLNSRDQPRHPSFFRQCEGLYRLEPRSNASLIEVSTIVTTKRQWRERPESRHPEWRVQRNTGRLVIAVRVQI